MLFKALNIQKSYGGVFAVKNASLYIEKNEIVGLIGSNGAGKTTLFNVFTGFEHEYDGDIFLNGTKITLKSPEDGIKHKFARTFQNIRVFENLTVEQNIRVATNACNNKQFDIKKALSLCDMNDKRTIVTKGLTYGQMRIVELLRAVGTGCEILFLDEPCAGMNNEEKQKLDNIIRVLKDEYSLSVLIIEHDIKFIKSISTRTYMMHTGEIICQGETNDVLNDKRVRSALLGEE